MMDLFDLTGKNAVVIGGTGGIGQSLAQGLAESGAHVSIASRSEEKLKKAQQEILDACGKKVDYYTVDVANEASVENLVKAILADIGRIDILINSQGLNKKMPAEDFDINTFAQMLDVNVLGVMIACKHFGKHMIGNGYGKIVNISSVRGKIATKGTGNAAYCTTKGGVDMLTKQLASEFGPHHITVNAIGPTLTETPMMTAIIEQRGGDEYRKTVANGLPMRRMAVPEDCIGTAIYLCSKASDFVTGNIIYPDGGLTCIG